jgi:predicted Zn finger-like uncharacterized protein
MRLGYTPHMQKGDASCPECGAGFRRIELTSISGEAGEFRCSVCDHLIEAWEGGPEIVYRLTVQPSLKGLYEA